MTFLLVYFVVNGGQTARRLSQSEIQRLDERAQQLAPLISLILAPSMGRGDEEALPLFKLLSLSAHLWGIAIGGANLLLDEFFH
ncbi:hypothetical protein [Pseudomonas sp. NFR16]|uniref:hypothetical protein n=1 Tax=Pseudomonas sp. NFR16 TaxID=1566248 RepID=UPI001160CA2D|nr:hypothetical protein [Pseudomonas sp. NFR16]